MRETSRLTCERCRAAYPNVSILKCNKFLPGGTVMCKTCHKRFHPTCDSYVTAIRPDDKLCDRCWSRDAKVVCPQCTGKFRCSQLCKECNDEIHTGLYQVHIDHLTTVPV